MRDRLAHAHAGKRMKRPAALASMLICAAAGAQQLDTHFSCSVTKDDKGEPAIFADSGEFRLNGDHIDMFRWESALHRSTHGFDCSIDEGDGLQAEIDSNTPNTTWRIGLVDPQQARERRGYTFDRIPRCTIRLERVGGTLNVKPTCPALCGSRANFTELSVDLKSGQCHYE